MLQAVRGHLVLPQDLLEDPGPNSRAFLAIDAPKTRRRGAPLQYISASGEAELQLFDAVWGKAPSHAKLFPGGARAFRKGWDLVLGRLGIPSSFRLTPGGIRGGGAVDEFTHGSCSIQDLLWRMRIKNQTTLEHYLQEVVARQIVTALPEGARHRVKQLQLFYDDALRHAPA